MKRALLVLLSIPLFFASCEKINKNKDKFDFRLRLISNSPVAINQKLTVQVKEVSDDYSYYIVTPQGMHISGPVYQVEQMKPSHQGWYKVFATNGEQTVSDSLVVKMKPAEISCSPPVNRLSCPAKFEMVFNKVVTGTMDGRYAVQGQSVFGNLTVVFDRTDKPSEAATYLSHYYHGDLNSGIALVYITDKFGGSSVNYFLERDQYIHLSKEGEKFYIILCEVPLMSGASYELVTARLEF